jgi:hypothetical protein
MLRFVNLLVLAAAFVLDATAARAGIVNYYYSTDSLNYVADGSGNATVNIYLVEASNGGTFSIAGDGGLASYAIGINRASGETGAAIQSVNPNDSLFAPGNLPYVSITQPQYAQFGNIDNNSTPKAPTPDVNGKIFLGSISIHATSGTTRFNLGPLFPGTGETTYTNGLHDLDYSNASSSYLGTADAANLFFGVQYFTVSAAAVPEPSSMILVCAIGLVGVARTWRSRKALPNTVGGSV